MAGESAQGPRSRRTMSIRTMLIGLMLVPLVGLAGLWIWIAAINLGNAFTELGYNRVAPAASRSAVVLLATVEKERLTTFLWLSSPRRPPESELTASWKADDAAIATYLRNNSRSQQATQNRALTAEFARLSAVRDAVRAGAMTAPGAFGAYSGIIDGLFAAYITGAIPDVNLYRHTLAEVDAGRALEQFSRELSLVAGAAEQRGRMSAADGALFSSAVGNQNLLVGDAITLSDDQLRTSLQRLYGSPLHRRLAALEGAIGASAGRVPLGSTLVAWGPTSEAFLKRLTAASADETSLLAKEAGDLSNELFLEAGLSGALGLVAVIATVLVMVAVSRRIRRELTGLYESAEEVAGRRLPALVERLRRGDDVDPETESPPLQAGRITEVIRVADAFSSVQSTAVETAVGQANMRKGVSRVFLNLSLRNQSLLHRQLRMIDALERATDNPSALADLFRLDHLTTRMRRNAENLIILSGSTPGRGWREPVPTLDILRAAVAEVEDYVRVEIVGEPTEAVVGAAANDVVHLLAELIENATAFSPPNTHVRVKAEVVGSGIAIEIEDRGVGIGADEIAEINAQLARPPGFDLSNSEQLGLFVVGQLAARHGIKVSLHGSHFGGTTAIVLLPHSIVAQRDDRDRTIATAVDRQHLAPAEPSSQPAIATTAITNPRRAFALSPAGQSWFGEPAPDRPAPDRSEPATAERPPLPFRVRQTNMAPQLRGDDAVPGASNQAVRPATRSAEETLALMSAFQDGWQRGRVDDHDLSGDGLDGRSDAGNGYDEAR